MSDDHNFAQAHVPTLKERTARKLGFGWRFGDEPKGADLMPGWFRTTATFRFSWRDRLRLLWSGALDIGLVGYASAPIDRVITRIDYAIKFDGKS